MGLEKSLEQLLDAFTERSGQKTHTRTDVYVNAYSGFGGSKDPMINTRFAPGRVLSQTDLDNLYRFDWMARRIVSAIPEDACRQEISLNIDDQDLSAKIDSRMDELNAWEKLEEALCLARLYGGSVMVVGATDGQDPTEPLNEKKIDRIRFLNNLDRHQITIGKTYDDPLEPNFGEPEIYRLQPVEASAATTHQAIHESRVIRLDGAYLPDRSKLQNQKWHDSVITGINETLKYYGTSIQAGAVLFQDFITKVLKIPNLADLIADGEEATLMARIQYAVSNMSSLGVSLIGQDEEFEKIQSPISGLTELMDKFVDIVAAASGIPKTRLFGQQLGTLAGADETTRNYYDLIKGYQKKHLQKPLTRLLSLLLAEQKATVDGWSFTFASLWQPTEKEVAETRKTVAETDQIYLSNDVVTSEEVAVSRFGTDGYSMETALDENLRKKFSEENDDDSEGDE